MTDIVHVAVDCRGVAGDVLAAEQPHPHVSGAQVGFVVPPARSARDTLRFGDKPLVVDPAMPGIPALCFRIVRRDM